MAISKDRPLIDPQVGRELMDGKGLCFTCHTMGKQGPLRFPISRHRLAGGHPGARLSDVEYLAQSLYEPDVFIVPGFNPGMPPISKAADRYERRRESWRDRLLQVSAAPPR